MSIESENRKESLRLRNSGIYPVANITLFDSVNNLKFSDYVLERENDLIEQYNNYCMLLSELSDKRIGYFTDALKDEEYEVNHLMEHEDKFFIDLSMNVDGKERLSANDYLLLQKKYTPESFIFGHKLLLKGTDSEKYFRKRYRSDNTTCVSKVGTYDGPAQIHYFAIDYNDIPLALEKLSDYSNGELHNEHLFLKPFILHGIISGLQMFDDGNTRYGRTVQNVQLYNLSCLKKDFIFKKPILYTSPAYKYYPDNYRNDIADLVIEESDEVWNRWLTFNINRCEEQLFVNTNRAEKYKEKKLL